MFAGPAKMFPRAPLGSRRACRQFVYTEETDRHTHTHGQNGQSHKLSSPIHFVPLAEIIMSKLMTRYAPAIAAKEVNACAHSAAIDR